MLAGEDGLAFEALRSLRKQIADEQKLPPYVIFHDSTLREMVAAKPRTISDLRRIKGVGDRKLATYGPRFLDALLRR
ncbi:MAG: HRDC domain-containing protein [Myxococcales bacterium]